MSTNSRYTALEQQTIVIQEAGNEWIAAKEISEQLDADEDNLLAAMMTEIEKTEFQGKKVSDAKLERLARSTPMFREYVRGRIAAQMKTLQLKTRYDNLDKLWHSKQSDQALEREKIAKGIYHAGQG